MPIFYQLLDILGWVLDFDCGFGLLESGALLGSFWGNFGTFGTFCDFLRFLKIPAQTSKPTSAGYRLTGTF